MKVLKNIFGKTLLRFSATAAVLLSSGVVVELLAQPPMPSNPDQAPLGGLAILAGAGGLYAVKKLRDRSK